MQLPTVIPLKRWDPKRLLLSQPSWSSELPAQGETLSQKIKWGKRERGRHPVSTPSLHVCIGACICAQYVNTHVCTKIKAKRTASLWNIPCHNDERVSFRGFWVVRTHSGCKPFISPALHGSINHKENPPKVQSYNLPRIINNYHGVYSISISF